MKCLHKHIVRNASYLGDEKQFSTESFNSLGCLSMVLTFSREVSLKLVQLTRL